MIDAKMFLYDPGRNNQNWFKRIYMKITLLHYVFAWLFITGSTLTGMQAQQEMSDADAIKSAKQLIRASHFKSNPVEKQELIQQAAKRFEPVYKNKQADPQLRFDAKTHLEGIYAKYPELKLPRIVKIMAQEDKNLTCSEQVPPIELQESGYDCERRIDQYFSLPENRKRLVEKMLGSELEQVRIEKKAAAKTEAEKKKKEKEKAVAEKLAKEKDAQKQKKLDDNDPDIIILETCTKLFQKKHYTECAQNCWTLIKSSNRKNIQKQAKNMLTILHEQKKDRDAAYYLAALEKDNPKKMIDLFLAAENRRDVLKEQKEFESTAAQAQLIGSMNEQPNAAEIVTATSDAMSHAVYELIHLNKEKYPNAFHALAAYYSHQATVFPNMQATLLQRSAHYAEQALSELTPKGCYEYPQILNNLGLAIIASATSNFNNKKISNVELQEKFNEALPHFKHASMKGYNFGTFNMAKIQERLFADIKQQNKLAEALASYQQALEEDAPEAQRHIEILLLEGIENIPLNIVQRQTLFNTLKAVGKTSELLAKKDFKNSSYYPAAQLQNKPGDLQFFEGLYWYDHGDHAKARELMIPIQEKHTAASCFLIDMDIHDANPDASLRAIKLFLDNKIKLEFPENVILSQSAQEALTRLIANNNLQAVYMSIDGCLSEKITPSTDPIKAVSKLLDKGEEILGTNQHTQMRMKFLEKSFLENLVNFAKRHQSPVILYKTITLALNRFDKPLLASESYELKRTILTLTLILNHNLQSTNKSFVPAPESAHALSQCIDQHMHGKEDQHYFQTLRSLQLILNGKPQLHQTIDPIQSADDALVYFLKKEAAKESLYITIALKSRQNKQAIDSLRAIIKLFRVKDSVGLYSNLASKQNTFDEVKNYLLQTTFSNPGEIFYKLNYHMLLIADNALTDKNYDLEKHLNAFCAEYPIMGTTMVAQELAANILFPKDIAKAHRYLARAKAETLLSGNKVEECYYIKEVEDTLKNAQ